MGQRLRQHPGNFDGQPSRPTLPRPTLLGTKLLRPTLLGPTPLRPTPLRPAPLRPTLLRPTLLRQRYLGQHHLGQHYLGHRLWPQRAGDFDKARGGALAEEPLAAVVVQLDDFGMADGAKGGARQGLVCGNDML